MNHNCEVQHHMFDRKHVQTHHAKEYDNTAQATKENWQEA